MRIVITGAGGGHFYPLLAVVDHVKKEAFAQKIVQPELYFISDKPYDEKALFDLGITYVHVPAGKLRVYFSLETITDIFVTMWGMVRALIVMYRLYPDVVFAKGGYASFPTLFAARLLSIPVVVHESDTVAGRTTMWAGGFASRVALSYPEAAKFFTAHQDRVAVTGQPIRDALLPPLNFVRNKEVGERPVLFILGGSQGSLTLNEAVIAALPELLTEYDVVHQAGTLHVDDVRLITSSILKDNEHKDRYFVDGFLDPALFYPKADLCITRAGSSLFEMALWQLPAIIVPISEKVSRDQRSNAYAYASRGAATVLEENNFTKNVFISEVHRILKNKELYASMVEAATKFSSSREASGVIARELIRISLSHIE